MTARSGMAKMLAALCFSPKHKWMKLDRPDAESCIRGNGRWVVNLGAKRGTGARVDVRNVVNFGGIRSRRFGCEDIKTERIRSLGGFRCQGIKTAGIRSLGRDVMNSSFLGVRVEGSDGARFKGLGRFERLGAEGKDVLDIGMIRCAGMQDVVDNSLRGVRVLGSDVLRRRRVSTGLTMIQNGVSGSRGLGKLFTSVSLPRVHLARRNGLKVKGFSGSMNGSSSSGEIPRFLTTNVTVRLTQHIVKELQGGDQSGALENEVEVRSEELAGSITSVMGEDVVDAFVESQENPDLGDVEIGMEGNVENELTALLNSGLRHQEDERWWHIPDYIERILPLPANFDENLEVLFRRFGSRIDSRELLLRVLVHKSYYENKIPKDIKFQEYLKPLSAMYIDSGGVKQQYVEGWPAKAIPLMTCGNAHGEVRSQLALLGDSLIGLAVTSLLVRQHSSAGTITERKCQLVSNSNLSRVWRTLLGPGEFVLSYGYSMSPLATQRNMMADSCEAYIGAVYAEKGFESAFNCVTNALLPLLVQADSLINSVYSLNAHSSMAFQLLPEYRLIGIDNKNTKHEVCRVRVYVKGIRMATGIGMNQKLARLDAARKALLKWPSVFGV